MFCKINAMCTCHHVLSFTKIQLKKGKITFYTIIVIYVIYIKVIITIKIIKIQNKTTSPIHLQ